MYPPPSEEIIRRLMDSDLDAVNFFRYVIHLRFENGNQLSIETPFRFDTRQNLSNSPANGFLLSESKLMRVLGSSINQFKCDTDGTLELQFTNGDALIIYANDPAFEAYTLSIDGKEYVV